MPRALKVSKAEKVAVAGMKDSGMSNREIADSTGLSMDTIWRVSRAAAPIPEEDLQAVKERLRGRFLIATDTLLESALRDAAQESPYKRMIMAGIAHDHYLRTLMFDRGQSGAGILAQLLIMVDCSQRGVSNPFAPLEANAGQAT